MRELSHLIRELRRRCPGLSLRENEPLAEHCSFRIGGPCAALVQPAGTEETAEVCRVLREGGETPLLMGRGTNLLIYDGYLPRIALQLGEGMGAIERRGDAGLFAQSGATLYRLATAAAGWGLAGLEFAHGIPGTLGGGVSMNAGAYGGELRDVVTGAVWLDGDTLTLREGSELALSYRRSRFTDTADVILGATLALREEEEEDAIRARMAALMERRRASQPLELPSAGSTFKRPAGGYAAALIDEAGLKGLRIGGAMVSEKHAGFVVNAGGASFDDVLRLMEEIQRRVLAVSGVTLEPELRIIRG